MPRIETYAEFKIHDGRLEDFKQRVESLVEAVKARDPATIRYDWFINEDVGECIAIDIYADEQAMYAHQGNARKYHQAVLECSDTKVEFLGAPSDEVLKAAAKFSPGIFTFGGGLRPVSSAADFSAKLRSSATGHIEIYTKFKIQQGKLDLFKKRATAVLDIVKDRDPGTLRYDWFYDNDNNECIAMDTYKNAPAMFAHMKNCHEAHAKLLDCSELTNRFLGALPDDAQQVAAKYKSHTLPFFMGLKQYSAGGFG